METNSTPSAAVLSELLMQSLTKDPMLAQKQTRLLQKIGGDSNSKLPADLSDSASSAPPASSSNQEA
jgi:hypothetical protein